jgi:hypothetical protein
MKRASLVALLAFWLVSPGAALAAGGPVPPVQDSYIGVPGVPYEYAAWAAGRDTIVNVKQAGARSTVPGLRLAGRYGVPGVDYAGSTTGLAAYGRTLILADVPANLPPRTTRLLVLDTEPLAVRARLTLPGWSAVDAISPDGRWLYLIHYPSANVSDYEVLAYDLVARRLLAKPIVDPRDREEAMTGFPISRVMGPGGRWAYTLYMRPSGVPFVHALDTIGRRAVCVDLPSLANADIGNAHLGLGPGGTELQIEISSVTRTVIDTRTFTLHAGDGSSARAPARPVSHVRRSNGGPDAVPWELVFLLIGVVAAASAQVARHAYRRRPEATTITVIDPRLTDDA